MSIEKKKARLRLMMIVAATIGSSSAMLSGTLAAFAVQDRQIASETPFA